MVCSLCALRSEKSLFVRPMAPTWHMFTILQSTIMNSKLNQLFLSAEALLLQDTQKKAGVKYMLIRRVTILEHPISWFQNPLKSKLNQKITSWEMIRTCSSLQCAYHTLKHTFISLLKIISFLESIFPCMITLSKNQNLILYIAVSTLRKSLD